VIFTILDRESDRSLAIDVGADGFVCKYHEDVLTLVGQLKHQLMSSMLSKGCIPV
jgi:hypothetical protein